MVVRCAVQINSSAAYTILANLDMLNSSLLRKSSYSLCKKVASSNTVGLVSVRDAKEVERFKVVEYYKNEN
jgi:hypothetical protein